MMGSTLPSPEQINFFNTFGYLAFPGLMADTIDQITGEFEAVWEERGGGHNGKPHDGTARSCIVPFIDQREKLCELLDDPRIVGIASSLLGADFNYMGSDGNFYVGDTNWRSDGWHTDERHIKVAFYLDSVTKDAGALRIIPGSHKVGDRYSDSLRQGIQSGSGEEWGISGREVPSVYLETRPGDLVCFNHNIKHATFGGGSRRRMFTMNLCERYPESRLAQLRKYLEGNARFWSERVYGEVMVATAGPERMRHLEQVLANDGHIAELSRQAREAKAEPARG